MATTPGEDLRRMARWLLSSPSWVNWLVLALLVLGLAWLLLWAPGQTW